MISRLGRCCSARCPQRIRLGVATCCPPSAETADATASHAVDDRDFAGVRPILRLPNKSCAHGILVHVVPFLAVTFIATEKMIVESGLPKRSENLSGNAWLFAITAHQDFVEATFQAFHPIAQLRFASRAEADKQVNVVRHDHVSPNSNVEFLSPRGVANKTLVQLWARENSCTPMRVERDEVNRRIEALINNIKAPRLAFGDASHNPCCSVRCPQRTRRNTLSCGSNSAEDSGRYSAPVRAKFHRV
jgi:hypothetical protein